MYINVYIYTLDKRVSKVSHWFQGGLGGIKGFRLCQGLSKYRQVTGVSGCQGFLEGEALVSRLVLCCQRLSMVETSANHLGQWLSAVSGG